MAVGISTHRHQHLEQQQTKQAPTISTPPYREYKGCFQYCSRPGGAGSFFAKPINGLHHPSDLPTIPAILDTKNERVYALQHGNCRLCCWNSWNDTGPDEMTAPRVELASPVLSMALLPMQRGMVYGTCLNGSIFVASVVTGDTSKRDNVCDSIVVNYIPTRQPKGTVHIGTLAELPAVAHQTKSSGRKRKISDADGNLPVVFYQTFCDGLALQIVRHELLFHGAAPGNNTRDVFKRETLLQRIVTLDLIRELDPSRTFNGLFLSRAELLISSSGTAPKTSLVFTVSTRSTILMMKKEGYLDSRLGSYCVSLSLASARFSHNPVRLPSRAVQFGLVTESSVAAATNDEIFLLDLNTGSLLQSKSMKPLGRDTESEWLLRTDTKHATIAVLYSKDGHLNVGFSNANVDENRKSLAIESIKASSKLASSMLVTSKQSERQSLDISNGTPLQLVVDFGRKETSISLKKLETSVHRMLALLEQSGRRIMHVNCHSDMHFLQVFQSCVSSLVKEIDGKKKAPVEKCQKKEQVPKSDTISYRNPQDSANDFKDTNRTPLQSPKTVITRLELEKQQLNGFHHSPTEDKKLLFYEKLPACLPQSFIDGALQITLAVIRDEPKAQKDQVIPSMEARMVLKLLLLSGRISARVHFEGSYVLQESRKKHPLILALGGLETPSRLTFSPVDFIHDLLQNCSDLSERQLVILLDYMLRKATVHDIAESARGRRDTSGSKRHKRLIRRYFKARDKRARLGENNDVGTNAKSNATELTTVSKSLLLIGVTVVLQKIIYYSECNEAMLREALRECLSSGSEAALLARLLSEMLLSPPYKIALQHKRHKNMTKVLCQWVAALCEGCRGELDASTTPSGETYLSFLINSVTLVTRNAQATIALKDGIGFANTKRRKMEREARKLAVIDSKTAHFTEKVVKEEDIPGYSIEKISF